jgi:hypothetical protein
MRHWRFLFTSLLLPSIFLIVLLAPHSKTALQQMFKPCVAQSIDELSEPWVLAVPDRVHAPRNKREDARAKGTKRDLRVKRRSKKEKQATRCGKGCHAGGFAL